MRPSLTLTASPICLLPTPSSHFPTPVGWPTHQPTAATPPRDGVGSHKLRAPESHRTVPSFSHQPRVQGVTWASEVPRTASLGSINLLRAAHRTQRTILLLDIRFITEGHNSGTAGWQRRMGQGGREASLSPERTILPEAPRVHLLGSSPNPVLQGFHVGFFTQP